MAVRITRYGGQSYIPSVGTGRSRIPFVKTSRGGGGGGTSSRPTPAPAPAPAPVKLPDAQVNVTTQRGTSNMNPPAFVQQQRTQQIQQQRTQQIQPQNQATFTPITTQQNVGFGLGSVRKDSIRIPIIQRARDVLPNIKTAVREAVVEGKPTSIITGAGSGFGLFDVGIGEKKADIELNPLPFEVRGTKMNNRVSPVDIGQVQEQNIIITGNLPPEVVVQRKGESIAKELQGRINTGAITYEDANIELNKKVDAYTQGQEFGEFSQIYGQKQALGDVSKKTQLSSLTTPVSYVGASIVAPQLTAGIFGAEFIGKATQSYGKGFLNKDLTTEQRAKAIGLGTLYAGIGLTSFGVITKNIARSVDTQTLKDLEMQSFKVSPKTSYRLKGEKGYADYLTASKKTGGAKVDLELVSTYKYGSKTSGGTGTTNLRFDSFETGRRTFTTQGFNFKLNKPIMIPKADNSIFQYGAGTGEIAMTQQINFNENPIKFSSGRSGIFKTNLPKNAKLEFTTTHFAKNSQKFPYSGGVAEGKNVVLFSSGKPTTFALDISKLGKINVRQRGTQLTQKFEFLEAEISGVGFTDDIYGALRIKKIPSPSRDKGFTTITSGGKKSGTSLYTPSTTQVTQQSFTSTSYPKISKIVGSSVINTAVKPSSSLVGVVPVSAYYGQGTYERTAGGLTPAVSGVDFKQDTSNLYGLKPKFSMVEVTKIKTDSRLYSGSGVSQVNLPKINQNNKIITSLKVGQQQKQLQKQTLKQQPTFIPRIPRSRQPPRIPRLIEPKVPIPFPKFGKSQPRKSRGGSFAVLGRRFGKFKVVGFGRTKGQALLFGKGWASRTLGTSFTIKGVTGKKSLKGFYTKKGKEGTVYTEKIGRRLKKGGSEVKEIQLYPKRRTKTKGGKK